MKESDAKKLLKDANLVIAQKGKKVIKIDLKKEKLSGEILKKFILGPTGNLRAPIVRKGKILLVGFDEESYKEVLK